MTHWGRRECRATRWCVRQLPIGICCNVSIEREGHKIRIKKPAIEDRIRRGDKVTDTGIQRVGPRARLHGMSGTMVVLAEGNAQ